MRLKSDYKIYLYLGGLVDHGLYLTCMQILVRFYSLLLLAESKRHHPKCCDATSLKWPVITISSQSEGLNHATDGLQWKSASSWGGRASHQGPKQKC